MKKLTFASLLICLAFSAFAAEIPDEKDLQFLADGSLVSFGLAIKKKDFSKFYDEFADVWQKQTTPDKLKDAFKDFFDKNIDLPAAIKDKEPVFNQPAKVNEDSVLLLKGYYTTTPNRVVFELKYVEESDEWRLVGINVKLEE